MSFVTGSQSETLFAGPQTDTQAAGTATTGYLQVAGTISTTQALVQGATLISGGSGFVQPFFQAGMFLNRTTHARVRAYGTVGSTGGTATTATFTVGTATAPQATTVGAATGAITLITSPAFTVTSFAAGTPWFLDCDLLCKGGGYGTTAGSTVMLTCGSAEITPNVAGDLGAVMVPQVTTTMDASVTQWVWVAVTFSTAVATNTCQCQAIFAYGMN